MDDPVWDVMIFTKNRERLIEGAVSQQLLSAVLVEARERDLLSEKHFTVDGNLIQIGALRTGPRPWGERLGPRRAASRISLIRPRPAADRDIRAKFCCATRWNRPPTWMRAYIKSHGG